jgi:lipoprotein-anchoring transpeptidase ErfK/SrfK
MRKFAIFLILLYVLLSPSSVIAVTPMLNSTQEGKTIALQSPDMPINRIICLPGVYLTLPADCTPAGPSLTLTSMAHLGLYYPVRPLPATSPDPELSKMPSTYVTTSKKAIPLYDSLSATNAYSPSQILGPGMKYLSIDQRLEQDNVIYYHLTSGAWVEGGSAGTGCCIYSGRFQGLVFSRTPASDFGWFVEETWSHSAPSNATTTNIRYYFRENVVAVYDTRQVGDTQWLMIGPDEWVEKRFIKRVLVNTTAPAGSSSERWIEVNLAEQTLAVYDQRQLVFATLVATGVDPFFTRPGLFQIQQKKELETMSGAFEADRSDFYYLEDVPWTMYYDQNRALHGAYWRTIFGYPQSHGCINLSPGDAHWLFDWANEGDWVYVWDPSGVTPTDPSFYGPGGA